MNKANTLTRLGGFAAGQFALSTLCYVVVWTLLLLFAPLIPDSAVWLFVALSAATMVPYFHMGMVLSGAADWARVSTARQFFLSLASQTAIAWLWAGAVLLCAFAQAPEWPAALIFLATLRLACPSSLFVAFGSGWWPFCDLLGDTPGQWVGFLLLAALAGLLPPLLYNLGNLFMARQLEKRADTPAAELPAQGR